MTPARRLVSTLVICGACALGWTACGSTSVLPAFHKRDRHIDFVGFNDNSVGQQLVTPAQDARLLSRTKANAVRVTLDWAAVERRPGDFDFAWADAVYRAMLARHIKVLWIPMFAPRWAAGNVCLLRLVGCHAPPAPAHDADWEALITDLASRYPASAGIEVWNEPNLAAFWQPRPNPARYTQLLKEAYEAAHGVNPTLPVVSGGLGDALGGPRNMSLPDFLRAMLADGARPFMSALGVHPYPYGPDETAFVQAMAQTRSILDHDDDQALPIWITEMGVSTTGPNGVTQAAQASELADLYKRAEAMPDVNAVFFHTLLDPPGPVTDPEVGYGVYASPTHAKRGARVLERLFSRNRSLGS